MTTGDMLFLVFFVVMMALGLRFIIRAAHSHSRQGSNRY